MKKPMNSCNRRKNQGIPFFNWFWQVHKRPKTARDFELKGYKLKEIKGETNKGLYNVVRKCMLEHTARKSSASNGAERKSRIHKDNLK